MASPTLVSYQLFLSDNNIGIVLSGSEVPFVEDFSYKWWAEAQYNRIIRSLRRKGVI